MNLRRVIVLITALFILGYDVGQRVQASTLVPGSADDPVVTVGYVKDYIDEKFKPVAIALNNSKTNLIKLSAKVEKLKQEKITFIIGKKTATIGSKSLQMETAPVVYKSRTIVPLRFIGDALHAQILWDNKTKTVTYIKGNNKIALIVNNTKATANGKAIKLDAAPILKEGRTLVPVRFISENLNAQVDYIAKTKTIIVKGK